MATYQTKYQPTRIASARGYGKQPQRFAPAIGQQRSYHPEYLRSPVESAGSISSGEVFSSSSMGELDDSSNEEEDEDDSPPNSARSRLVLAEYMNDRVPSLYDADNLDRVMLRQVKHSAELNAKEWELHELQAKVRQRMAGLRPVAAQAMHAAQETQRNSEWTQQKIRALNARAAEKYPAQYRAANQRYPRERME